MKNTIKAFTAILSILIFFSCGKNNLEADAKMFMENEAITKAQGYLKLSSFSKIDGIARNTNGVESYEMTISIEIECVKDGAYVNILRNGTIGGFSIFKPEQIDNYVREFYQPAKVGNRYTKEGIVFFEKHDSGWVILGWQPKN